MDDDDNGTRVAQTGSLSHKTRSSSYEKDRVYSLEKETSKMELNGIGSGKKASLYLSRAASTMKPENNRTQSQKNTGKNEQNTGSRPGSKQINDDVTSQTSVTSVGEPVLPIQREFTFTGYDIMADTEPIYKPEEDEKEREKRENVQYYISACKVMGINPVSYLAKHINDRDLVMKSRPVGPDGTRALCIALVQNRRIKTLDLEDNDIGPDGAEYITDMLRENEHINEVHLAENMIGTRGVFAFTDLIRSGRQLHTLDLSGSNLEDGDAKYIADIIEFSPKLRVFSCRNNKLGDAGAFDIGRAMAINDTLIELDISWNHIRGKGALAIAMGLQKNVSLKRLDISWNGFSTEGSAGIGRALEENRTLVDLNLANNRIGVAGVGSILKGLQQNDGLKALRIGQNPYSPEVAFTILKAIEQSEKCVLTTLDLTDIAIRTDFLQLLDEIKSKRVLPLRVTFGAVVKAQSAPSHESYDIDWRDPVVRMFKFMQDKGYRVIDLLKRLDKDRNFSVDREEFKQGLIAEDIPMTEAQLDEVIERLDKDGDGEVDLAELMQGEKLFKKKMRARMRRLLKNGPQVDESTQKLMKIAEL